MSNLMKIGCIDLAIITILAIHKDKRRISLENLENFVPQISG